jgi:hypothetical protein
MSFQQISFAADAFRKCLGRRAAKIAGVRPQGQTDRPPKCGTQACTGKRVAWKLPSAPTLEHHGLWNSQQLASTLWVNPVIDAVTYPLPSVNDMADSQRRL